MRNPIRTVLLAGGLFVSVAAAPPPQPSAEKALAIEQDELRNALHPSCTPSDGEILVCGHRQSDRDRLPLRDASSHALPGEPASAVAAMNAIGPPHIQTVGGRPRGGDKPPFFDIGAMVLLVGVRLIDRDRDPPPIPPHSAAN